MQAKPNNPWPELPFAQWQETCATLQLWTQIIGKIRLACTPWLNHSWHVALYVSARGLTTGPIPYAGRYFELVLDFCSAQLVIDSSDARSQRLMLKPGSVAAFYAEVLDALRMLDLDITINTLPSEIPAAIRFSEDQRLRAFDAPQAQRFWQALLQIDRVFKLFRSGFLGKCSPVHFFWGSFDLAVTRFSGRRAPLFSGSAPGLKPAVMREAYSHEVSSAGFWPGGNGLDEAAFYSYAYPTPPGFREWRVAPAGAHFSEALGEFLLPYEQVRQAADPDAVLLAFLDSTYEAAAVNARWDRSSLECARGTPGVPRAV
jgi:hypothetical protein